jgi:hypothetical protein
MSERSTRTACIVARQARPHGYNKQQIFAAREIERALFSREEYRSQSARVRVQQVMDRTLVNHGVIAPRSVGADPGLPAQRTVIVTGLGRSGTSMVAALLMEAGLPIGTFLADTVYEDREFVALLGRNDRAGLLRAIAARNAADDIWGFKFPNLHRHMHHADLALFRNARLIIPFRDIAAVAVRHAIAEHWDPFQALTDIADGTVALVQFARLTGCPVLLLSYEKALAFPDETISEIVGFCGLSADILTRTRMRACINPNNADYATQARRSYEGLIERLDEEGRLVGWCREVGEIAPVRLELLAGTTPVACFDACLPRNDLLEAGFGNGNHGFAQKLDLAALSPDTQLHVRVQGTVWEMPGSGRCVADLLGPPLAAASDRPEPVAEPAPVVTPRPPRAAARRGGGARSNGNLPHANGVAEQRGL